MTIMTTAEKLVKIAKNEQKVYEAGQKSMVDESKIIEKTVSGSVIALDDVSEVPHEVSVQLSSDTVTDFSGVAVKVLGKNLFDGIFELGIIAGSSGKEVYDAKYVRSVNYIPVVEGVSYVFSYIPVITTPTLVYEYTADYTYNNTNYVSVVHGSTYIPSKNTKYIRFRPNNNTVDLSVKCQMEVGTVSTVYEAYISEKTYAVGADGKALAKSISPYMTITTDTADVNITATYHKSWGMQTEYDKFWDAYQGLGEVIAATSMFSGSRWNDTCYNPKIAIKASSFSGMYQNSQISDTKVPLDFTYGSGTDVFRNASKLRNIEKIIVDSDNAFSNWFYNCTALEEIRFEGTIGNSLDIHWSTKLSFESLVSIVSALSKTVTGQTITLPTTARQTYDNATISGAWDNLVKQYTNWTFAYA